MPKIFFSRIRINHNTLLLKISQCLQGHSALNDLVICYARADSVSPGEWCWLRLCGQEKQKQNMMHETRRQQQQLKDLAVPKDRKLVK